MKIDPFQDERQKRDYHNWQWNCGAISRYLCAAQWIRCHHHREPRQDRWSADGLDARMLHLRLLPSMARGHSPGSLERTLARDRSHPARQHRGDRSRHLPQGGRRRAGGIHPLPRRGPMGGVHERSRPGGFWGHPKVVRHGPPGGRFRRRVDVPESAGMPLLLGLLPRRRTKRDVPPRLRPLQKEHVPRAHRGSRPEEREVAKFSRQHVR
mmetsp:Transcript_51507/g.154634  ORF Transcript_51507/g.154634 Transcript_51507/m.154634 type:complete len:210 (-) Transcript_51507:1988-2617(-)